MNSKTTSNQNPRSPRHTSLDPDSDFDSNCDLDYSDSYSDPGTDPDTYPDTDDEPNIGIQPDLSPELKDTVSDSEAEEILKDIGELRKKGLAKPNHEPYIKKLWKREGEIWENYCQKIKVDPEGYLRKCDPAIYKAYLRWRKRYFQIKKEDTMRSYWKRISMCYRDLARHKMDGDVLTDACDIHISTIFLSRSYILIATVVDSESSA